MKNVTKFNKSFLLMPNVTIELGSEDVRAFMDCLEVIKRTGKNSYETDRYNAFDENDAYYKDYNIVSEPQYSYFEEDEDDSNPYGSSTYYSSESSDEEIGYVLPSPDKIASKSIFNVPPPREIHQEKFYYTLKNGKTLELDHPLPSCLPIELLEEQYKSDEQEETRRSDFLLYTAATIIPIAGPILYAILKKKRPVLARRLLKVSIASIVAIGSLLFILL